MVSAFCLGFPATGRKAYLSFQMYWRATCSTRARNWVGCSTYNVWGGRNQESMQPSAVSLTAVDPAFTCPHLLLHTIHILTCLERDSNPMSGYKYEYSRCRQ